MNTDQVVTLDANNTVTAVQADIILGHSLLDKAENAFQAGDLKIAECLLESAGQLDADVLRQVCVMTEAESDDIAMALAPFEDRLYQVAVLLGVLPGR